MRRYRSSSAPYWRRLASQNVLNACWCCNGIPARRWRLKISTTRSTASASTWKRWKTPMGYIWGITVSRQTPEYTSTMRIWPIWRLADTSARWRWPPLDGTAHRAERVRYGVEERQERKRRSVQPGTDGERRGMVAGRGGGWYLSTIIFYPNTLQSSFPGLFIWNIDLTFRLWKPKNPEHKCSGYFYI